MTERPSHPARFGRYGGRIGRPPRGQNPQEIERLFRIAKALNRARMVLTDEDIWSGPTTAALAVAACPFPAGQEDT